MLRLKTNFQSATCARSSDAIQSAKSNFPAHSKRCRVDIAGKFGDFKIFRFLFAVADDSRAALRAELRPAALIHSFKRP
jgi:hypothetical protein